MNPRGAIPVLAMVARRALSNPHLVLAGAFGLMLASGLLASVPLYAEAAATQGLRRELAAPSSDRTMPRASILLSYAVSRGASSLPLEQYRRADTFAREQTPALTGLPTRLVARYTQTDSYTLLASPSGSSASTPAQSNGFLAFLDGLAEHAEILEGRLPRSGGDLEALISTELLDELGIAVGDQIQVVVSQTGGPVQVPVRVVGRWRPRDPEESYWFNKVDYYRNALFLPEQSYFGDLLARVPRAAREYDWYFLFDPQVVRVGELDGLLRGFAQLRTGTAQVLRGLKVDASPEELLEAYGRRAFFLQVLLLALSAPVLAIVLQFIAMLAGLLVERQRGEIACLKSRGATTGHILGIYLLEWSILGGLGTLAGPALGAALAQFVGQSSTFLVFGGQELLPVAPDLRTFLYAGAAAALSVAAALAPALGAARHSIVTYKQEVSRSLDPGLLRRFYVDLLPLPLAAYAYYLLLQRRSVLPVGEAGDAFSDPLLLLAPALSIFAAALLFLRAFPLLVAVLERLIGPLLGVPALVALRQIARQPREYSGLVLALTLTVALGGFSASVAATMDRNYADVAAYRVGTDLRLDESGAYDEETQEWTFVPLDEHLNVSGVRSVARALRLTGTERLGTRGGEVAVLGIDAADFGAIAHWRPDYAPESLGALLNALAADETAALVDRRLLEAYRVQVGDQINVAFKQQSVDFTVAGVLDYFPTLYPDGGRFLVANLDYLFDQLSPQPYEVWARLAPEASAGEVVEALRERDVPVVRFEDLSQAKSQHEQDPTRLGVFGLLSIGFLVAALLTVLSLLLYSYLSFRRRLQQIGVLRALGLSLRQLTSLYLLEQGFLVVLGAGAGTLLGIGAGWLFIPFLQIKAEQHAGVPPFVVLTAWGDLARLYLILGLFLAAALPSSLWLLRRVRIHQAIKFGEERG